MEKFYSNKTLFKNLPESVNLSHIFDKKLTTKYLPLEITNILINKDNIEKIPNSIKNEVPKNLELMNFYVNIDGKKIELEPSYLSENDNEVFIFKYTTKTFKNTIVDSLLYLFSDIKVSKICLIFPLHNYFWKFDLINDKWDNIGIIKNLLFKDVEDTNFGNNLVKKYNIGNHIGKLKTLLQTVQNISNKLASYQLFLGSPTSKIFNILLEDSIKTKEYVKKHNLKIFVHLPYIFNLATPNIYPSIVKYLECSYQSGFLGCVIHVPKFTKSSIEEARINSINNILKILEETNIECPLILETPAGQGTEMLTNKEDFLNFVKEIDIIKPNKLKICIDTAHIFSTNYQPTDYINYVLNNSENLLKLIHFNDSKVCLGACRDLHEFLGCGFIPKNELSNVAKIAKENNISLVIE
jgi:deoxyribonuclease-4